MFFLFLKLRRRKRLKWSLFGVFDGLLGDNMNIVSFYYISILGYFGSGLGDYGSGLGDFGSGLGDYGSGLGDYYYGSGLGDYVSDGIWLYF